MTHGPVMLDVAHDRLTAEDRDLLRHPAVGGVILFARNYHDPRQLRELVAAIHALRAPALFVAVDQEGGRVQRFREGFTTLPPAAWYGQLYAHSPAHACTLAEQAGWLMAAELRAAGVDFSFAPVLDLGGGPSRVIGERAFHPRPIPAAALAQAWVRGAHEAGMASVGKHFPGHGGVEADSHVALPIDERPYEDLQMDDLIPFQRLIDQGLEAIMPAHVIYRRCAPEPAGFSPFWLGEVLRRRLGFQGVIFSDDLSMAAAGHAGGPAARARAALAAGCDMVLVCNDRPAALQVVETLRDHADPVSQTRLVRMHGRRRQSLSDLRLDPRWRSAVRALATHAEALELNLAG
jgi:beta-N-acetylhexosaminidase